MDTHELASRIDHTMLTPEASGPEVRAFCDGAQGLGVASVCVTAAMAAVAIDAVGGAVPVAAVVGFPSGAHLPSTKAAEAEALAELGVAELDVVASLGAIAGGDWAALRTELAEVRGAAPDVTLKVIVESALWPDDVLISAVEVCEQAGADFVKTSTGFHPLGGATVAAVRTMAAAVGGRIGVKASGGIRDRSTAETMLDAGATRLGCSRTAEILAD